MTDPAPSNVSPQQALELATAAAKGTLMERLGMEWLEIGTDRIVAKIPVKGNVQVYGQLHGGATAALIESVGSIGTAVVTGLEKRVVGIQLSVNHLRAVSDGYVTATGVPIRVGRTVAVWDVRVEDDAGKPVAAGTLTVAIRES